MALSETQSVYSESLEYLATHSVFFVFYEMLLGMYIYHANKAKGLSIIPLIVIALYGRIYDEQWFLDTAIFGIAIYILSSVSVPNIKWNFINKVLHIIDEYSYSIYLGHTTVMFIFSRLQEKIGYSNLVLAGIDLIGCIIFIPILHNVIEKPMAKLILPSSKKD